MPEQAEIRHDHEGLVDAALQNALATAGSKHFSMVAVWWPERQPDGTEKLKLYWKTVSFPSADFVVAIKDLQRDLANETDRINNLKK